MTSKNLAPPNFGIKSGSSTKLNSGALADWAEMKQEIGSDHGDTDSEVSESETFLGKSTSTNLVNTNDLVKKEQSHGFLGRF